MLKLIPALKAWGTPEFESVLKALLNNIDPALLPLQAGLSQSSHVSDGDISILILNISQTADAIIARTGVFYAGVIMGSCCTDDPTPLCEQTEYCELQFTISKGSAETTITLLT